MVTCVDLLADVSEEWAVPAPVPFVVGLTAAVAAVSPDLGLQASDVSQDSHELEVMAYRTDETVRNR